MDNPLTPNRIQMLIRLAEDRSNSGRNMLAEEDFNQMTSARQSMTPYESSSGILDLDIIEGFGESENGSLMLSKSTNFNPGEMTGRSTGAEDGITNSRSFIFSPTEELGRHSLAIGSITSKMDSQTSEINDIMRHSIATNYSFHSKRDLTADEASMVARQAVLPAHQLCSNITEDPSIASNSNLSVGAYFSHRCAEFGQILSNNESPNRSYMMPSITEVTPLRRFEQLKVTNQSNPVDESLDCIPVKQPRKNNAQKSPEQQVPTNKSFNLFKLPKPLDKKLESSSSKIPVKPRQCGMNTENLTLNKSFMRSSKPADVLLKNLHSSFRPPSEETEGEDSSLSISKIADYLGNQSNVSVSEIMQINRKKTASKKQPLTELNMNTRDIIQEQEPRKINEEQVIQVTNLKDSRKSETASSAGTSDTVIAASNFKAPKLIVTSTSDQHIASDIEAAKSKRQTNSKSPSSKSPSTITTVRENVSSFKFGDSPLSTSRDDTNRSKVPSPNLEYKELDKSVDWQDVLLQKRVKENSLAKEQWIAIEVAPVEGFVGVSCAITIRITILTDSWLTGKFRFDDLPKDGDDLNIELPRMPLVLAPGKCELFRLHITSNVELSTTLPFTILLKDTAVECDVPQKGNLQVTFTLPIVQAMTADGMNKLTFPPILEKTSSISCFVLISDCPADLQIEMSIVEGVSLFHIKNVQEVKKSDVNKILMEGQETAEQTGKSKGKSMNNLLCRLTNGSAIKVTVCFSAPILADLQITEQEATFSGVFKVSLIGGLALRKVDLIGVVGTANLVVNIPGNKLHLTKEPTNVTLTNTGSASGAWKIKITDVIVPMPFKLSPVRLEIAGGSTEVVDMAYIGPEDNYSEATIAFDEIASGKRTTLDICGGHFKPKTFPIKTNYVDMSWVRAGRKEISLKNGLDKKIHIRCQIVGEGFSIDLPGVETRGSYCLPFAPHECRKLPVLFAPTAHTPCAGTLHLVFDKNSDFSRKVKLFGSAGGESLRWSGLATFGDTALVRAGGRAPVALRLYNRAAMPAFACARVHFNLPYRAVEATSALQGARRVVPPRAHHSVTLHVEWARVERRAREGGSGALATLTVLCGAELTRRRILRIIRDESTGELDTSLLPDRLKVLVDQFEGEDSSMEEALKDFEEPKTSLGELIGDGLQELTAQIDLPQDFGEENTTIIIADDTIVDHYTLCE